MICRLVFNLTCDRFQSKLFVVRTKIRMTGLSRAAWHSRLASCLVVFTTVDVDLEGRVRTVFKVLIGHFLCSWQGAKTPGGTVLAPSSGGVFVDHMPYLHNICFQS